MLCSRFINLNFVFEALNYNRGQYQHFDELDILKWAPSALLTEPSLDLFSKGTNEFMIERRKFADKSLRFPTLNTKGRLDAFPIRIFIF